MQSALSFHSLPLKTELFNQAHLEQAIRDLFPIEKVVSNARKQSQVTNPKTGSFFELDIWLPEVQIGFEFQDNYHYMTTWYSQLTLDVVRTRDDTKRDVVSQNGITLIGIPCWWNIASASSLAATIAFERPDLAFITNENESPIFLNPPANFFNINPVPDVGELMYASYPSAVIPVSLENPWWLGEKYDGIRFCWNCDQQTVYGRSGIEFTMLPKIIDSLPQVYLDCEAWFGRGYFADTQRLVKSFSVNWPMLRLLAFDSPDPRNQELPFETRYKILTEQIPLDHHLNIIAPRMWCTSAKQLNQMLETTINDGGEGLIIRKPLSPYERGRSELLWKLKATRGDMEALVMKVEEDKSLLLQLPSGITFTVSPNQSEVAKVKRGDVVTFSFDNFSSNSLPVNPMVTRVRFDTTWENVVKDFMQQKLSSLPQILTEHSLIEDAKKKRPIGFWGSDEKAAANIRNYFEDFAKARNLDPLLASTWYTLAPQLLQQQHAKYIFFKKFNNYVDALQSTFPNIGLNATKFDTLPHRYWADVKKRREYFCQFAKYSKFNPLVAENWYSASPHTFLLYKNTRSILSYYDGNYAKALIHLFPDVELDKSRLPNLPNKYWHSKLYHRDIKNMETENTLQHRQLAQSEGSSEVLEVSQDAMPYLESGMQAHNRKKWANQETRREFFVSFAKNKKMDPLVAENWYSITNVELLENKDARIVLNFYDGNLGKALVHLFPEVRFARNKFTHGTRKKLSDSEIQRDFFIDFARGKGFDPLVAENWYLNAHSFTQFKGAKALLTFFGGSVSKGLQNAFPELTWDSKKFKYPEKKYESSKFQREFFENFAKDRKFDPLIAENWYSIPMREIMRRRGAKAIMAYNHQNIVKALVRAFPNLELDITRFRNKLKKNFWNSAANRREFFEQYARDHNFSPLSASDWYKVKLDDFMKTKKAVSVMAIYKNRFEKALMDLFPEIGLDKKQIRKGMLGHVLSKDKKKLL